MSSMENGLGAVRANPLKKVECILCSHVVQPPVMQCKNHHIVCNPCRDLNPGKCPESECNEDLSTATRSTISEKFLEKYVLRCKYFNDGTGCFECCLKDEPEIITEHVNVCSFREVKCLVPNCYQHIRWTKYINHLANEHGTPKNETSNVQFNLSQIILSKRIIQENWADRAFKTVVGYAIIDDKIFLCIFRMASTRNPVFEISSVIYPYNCEQSEQYFCRIEAKNDEDPNAKYIWEGPLQQIYPLTPLLTVKDELAKLKWVVTFSIFKRGATE